MPRQPHEPTNHSRELVSLHASVGTPQEVIADILGIDSKTLRKHYRKELDQSVAKANAAIGGTLFNKAKSGDTSAAIFWMKTRAGWSEKTRTEITHRNPDDMSEDELRRAISELDEQIDKASSLH